MTNIVKCVKCSVKSSYCYSKCSGNSPTCPHNNVSLNYDLHLSSLREPKELISLSQPSSSTSHKWLGWQKLNIAVHDAEQTAKFQRKTSKTRRVCARLQSNDMKHIKLYTRGLNSSHQHKSSEKPRKNVYKNIVNKKINYKSRHTRIGCVFECILSIRRT